MLVSDFTPLGRPSSLINLFISVIYIVAVHFLAQSKRLKFQFNEIAFKQNTLCFLFVANLISLMEMKSCDIHNYRLSDGIIKYTLTDYKITNKKQQQLDWIASNTSNFEHFLHSEEFVFINNTISVRRAVSISSRSSSCYH